MLKLLQLSSFECSYKIRHEFILRFLRQRHPQQPEFFRGYSLTDVIGKTEIAREAQFKIFHREAIEFSIIQTLHPQRMH